MYWQKGVKMNKKEYMKLVAELNCIVTGAPAQLHHPKSIGCGAGQKCSDWLVIPLSKKNHDDIHKHMNIDGKDEADLLAETIQAVVQKINKEKTPF